MKAEADLSKYLASVHIAKANLEAEMEANKATTMVANGDLDLSGVRHGGLADAIRAAESLFDVKPSSLEIALPILQRSVDNSLEGCSIVLQKAKEILALRKAAVSGNFQYIFKFGCCHCRKI